MNILVPSALDKMLFKGRKTVKLTINVREIIKAQINLSMGKGLLSYRRPE